MKDQQTPTQTRVKNLSYAALGGQAGCATLVVVIAALFIGLWLDSLFGVRGPFTIGLLVLSIPFSLYMMLRIALGAIGRITPKPVVDASDTSSDNKEKRSDTHKG